MIIFVDISLYTLQGSVGWLTILKFCKREFRKRNAMIYQEDIHFAKVDPLFLTIKSWQVYTLISLELKQKA